MARPPQLVHVAGQAARRAHHDGIGVAVVVDGADKRACQGKPLSAVWMA
ncbi:MAG: hypothetical protein R2911_30015 [Caldilineaceae bacterium]